MSSLRNDWRKKTYYLFEDAKCWWCDSAAKKDERVDALHHILGRCSNSPLNACPIHNFHCHIGNGKLSWKETKIDLLQKNIDFLSQTDYELTEKDEEFIKNHEELYSEVEL